MEINNRVEKFVRDAILANKKLASVYKDKVFLSYAAPNTLTSCNSYILIQRISAVTLDKNYIDGTVGDTLRRVRLQVDVCDTEYERGVKYSESVKKVLKQNFPACIDDETTGYKEIGQSVWNVFSTDILLTEEEDYYGD